MYVRMLFYLLFLFLINNPSFGQANPEELEKAQDELSHALVKYSKLHINYAQAALHLAALLYKDYNTQRNADSLSYNALRFIRNNKGANSENYRAALESIPQEFSDIIDITLDTEDALNEYGAQSPIYGKSLLKLGIGYLSQGKREGLDFCFKALYVYSLDSEKDKEELYQYALKHLDSTLITLLVYKIELQQVSDTLSGQEGEGDALVRYAKLLMQEKNIPAIVLAEENIYDLLKKALIIYEKKLGKSHEKYQSTYALLSKEMQAFLPTDISMNKRLDSVPFHDDDFFFYFRKYLELVDQSSFLSFNSKDIFANLQKTHKKHRGEEHQLFYNIIRNIQSNWGKSDAEIELETTISTQKSNIQDSVQYALALIKLANLRADKIDEREAVLHYLEAFALLQNIEDSLDYSLDIPYINQYISLVKEPWKTFVYNEHNLKIKQGFGSKNEDLALQYFQTSYDYLKVNKITLRGERYFRAGLRALDARYSFVALPWLDSLFSLDLEKGAKIVAKELPTALSLTQTKDILKNPLLVLAQRYGEFSLEYALVQEILADAYFEAKRHPDGPTVSLRLYQKILSIYKNKDDVADNYTRLLKKIVRQIEKESPWALQESAFFFEALIQTLKEQQVSQRVLESYLLKFANWHYSNERLIDSEHLFEEIIGLYSTATQKEKSKENYLSGLYNIARIYRKTGRYKDANLAYTKALQASQLAKNEAYIIQCMDDLGILAADTKEYELALKRFNLSLDYFNDFEASTPYNSKYRNIQNATLYTKLMRHIARYYLDAGNVQLAKTYYEKIKAFEDDKESPIKYRDDISLIRDYALLYGALGDNEKAEAAYKLAIRRLKDHQEKAEAIVSFAQYYENQELDSIFDPNYHQKRFYLDSLAATQYLTAIQLDLEQIEISYPKLAEKDRLLFLAPISKRVNSFFAFVVKHPLPDLLIAALNAQLSIKGLSLETSMNFKSICATENTVSINQCAELDRLQKGLTKAALASANEQDVFRKKIDSLEQVMQLTSGQIIQRYGQKNKKLNFQKLQEILSNKQHSDSLAIAIDFLLVDELDEYGDEIIVYYALLTDHQSQAPKLIRLANQEEFQDVLGTDVAPNTINYISDGLESNYLYQLVWEPLLPYIQKAKALHISPTGILSRIAFGTLLKESFGQHRVMDSWSIHYYGSLRDLLTPPTDSIRPQEGEIGLVGGVNFSFTQQELKQQIEIENQKIAQLEKAPIYSSQLLSGTNSSTGNIFAYLPGTLSEIEAIGALFINNNWTALQKSGTQATEENIYDLADYSPSILHFATHGYFFANPDNLEDNPFKKEKSFENRVANQKNPLLRSGLALGNINRVWEGAPTIDGLEDGILTALEVSTMDLFKTNLVVLSACETGRGDIDNNEGIMGLRRAFRIAGAKQLITSLWKVPDAQTSELMQLFYEQYLAGKSAHQAFENAQHIMRKRYANPYYWAAFLLIE